MSSTSKTKTTFIKISPDINDRELDDICNIVLDSAKIDGLILTNNHVVEYYKKYWSPEKSLYDAKVNIAVANSYVTSKFGVCINIPGVWIQQEEFIDQYIYDWADISYITESLCDFRLDSVPDGHYGPKTHESFAQYLSKYITSNISIL